MSDKIAKLPFFEDHGRIKVANIKTETAYDVLGISSFHKIFGKGSPEFPIGIADTGVDLYHVETNGKVLTQVRNIGKDGDELHPHGTHVAGIIVGHANIKGIAPDATLHDAIVLDKDGAGSEQSVIEGILAMVEEGARIINMSLGFHGYSRRLANVIKEQRQKGVLFICAAGNEGKKGLSYPGKDKNTIAVAAARYSPEIGWAIPSFSSRGSEIHISANGYKVTSAIPNNNYADFSGTSMACPFVAGAANIAMSARVGMTQEMFEEALTETAYDILRKGKDTDSGHGVINPFSLVNTLVGQLAEENAPKYVTMEQFKALENKLLSLGQVITKALN